MKCLKEKAKKETYFYDNCLYENGCDISICISKAVLQLPLDANCTKIPKPKKKTKETRKTKKQENQR